MSSRPTAIDARNVSKTYRVVDPDRTVRRFRRTRRIDFAALHQVSLAVAEGEILGLIGRNGAGKSTLLKIFSRITAPDEGEVDLYGRVGSLLEVGTGFHPELTGRENVFLNGSILGMRRREIEEKFDEILEFSGVQAFIDTPVKRYSSGMYVRLAFAVAAHLDSEILVVDEVLAVGDAAFQAKCMARIESAAVEEGRTILFVSHNMGAVLRLCTRAVVLERGRVTFDGSPRDAVARYLETVHPAHSGEGGAFSLAERDNQHPPHELWFTGLTVRGRDGGLTNVVDVGDTLAIGLDITPHGDWERFVVGIALKTEFDQVLSTFTTTTAVAEGRRPMRATLRIPSAPLTPGWYAIDVAVTHVHGGPFLDEVVRAGTLRVVSRDHDDAEWERQHGAGPVIMTAEWDVTTGG